MGEKKEEEEKGKTNKHDVVYRNFSLCDWYPFLSSSFFLSPFSKIRRIWKTIRKNTRQGFETFQIFESVGRSQCWKLKRRAFGAEAKVVESRSEELTQGSVNVSREKKGIFKNDTNKCVCTFKACELPSH